MAPSMDAIVPDTKDWTWVLARPCSDCDFAADGVDLAALPDVLRAGAREWATRLAQPDARTRPEPSIWSPLEYAAHVRDVHRVFAERVRLMLDQDDPTFVDWDQDATAVAERYGEQDPAVVADELVAAADDCAAVYDGVGGDQWARRGHRDNGSDFTVESLARYQLHDLVHHAWDCGVGG